MVVYFTCVSRECTSKASTEEFRRSELCFLRKTPPEMLDYKGFPLD